MAKQQQETRYWDQYAAEAEVPDFVIKASKDGDEVLRVHNPTGVQIMRVAQGIRSGDLDLMLLGLTGDRYEDAVRLLSTAGHKALPSLIEDLMDHFGLYEEIELVGPGGGVVRETRPTKVQQLLKVGYKVKGEAQASWT